MATKKQIMANRTNAQKSTGPQSPGGKTNSSRNATKHGLFANDVVAAGEAPELYDALLEALMDEHQPTTATESLLVERIALAFWREKRLALAEKKMMESSSRVQKFLNPDGKLGQQYFPREVLLDNAMAEAGMLTIEDQLLIGRYQTMISNQIRQAMSDLREERAWREKTIDAAPYVQITDDSDEEPSA
jgi:hypothetical protein